jgi:hypothetical protein
MRCAALVSVGGFSVLKGLSVVIHAECRRIVWRGTAQLWADIRSFAVSNGFGTKEKSEMRAFTAAVESDELPATVRVNRNTLLRTKIGDGVKAAHFDVCTAPLPGALPARGPSDIARYVPCLSVPCLRPVGQAAAIVVPPLYEVIASDLNAEAHSSPVVLNDFRYAMSVVGVGQLFATAVEAAGLTAGDIVHKRTARKLAPGDTPVRYIPV